MRFSSGCFLLCIAFFLAACGGRVEKVDYNPLIEIPQDRKAAPADLRRLSLDLPVGAQLGMISSGARSCGWPFIPLTRENIQKAFDAKSMREAFDERLEAIGYDIVGGQEIIFDEERSDEVLRTEYLIGARIKSMQVDICEKDAYTIFLLMSTTPGMKGELKMTVEWTIYDRLRQNTIFKTQTQGYSKREIPNLEGMTLLMNDAFAMAAHNLGTSGKFRDVLFFEKHPDELERQYERDHRIRPRMFERDEIVSLHKMPLSETPIDKIIPERRRAVVLVQAGEGHGSGFVISDQGHILTNSHVVGDALKVRVETAGKEHALIAEVLRRDPSRDVAVLKLTEIPKDFYFEPMPLRLDWPEISEDVYSIGAPLSKRLSETVRKGIVSAHRKDFRLARDGNFIQADVGINAGNSGGPLLDKHGNVVGLAVAGFETFTGDEGLNLFIPIEEALQNLDIKVKSKRHVTPLAPEILQNDSAGINPVKGSMGAFSPRGLKIRYLSGEIKSEGPSRKLYHNISAPLDD